MVAEFSAAMNLNEQMTQLAKQAKAASRELAKLSTRKKMIVCSRWPTRSKKIPPQSRKPTRSTWKSARNMDLSAAMLDRLQLDDKRIAAMAKGLREVAALARSGRKNFGRTRPAQWLEAAKNFHAHRRGRHHLRIAPERDGGRREPVFQIRQRDDFARRQGSVELQSNHRADHD